MAGTRKGEIQLVGQTMRLSEPDGLEAAECRSGLCLRIERQRRLMPRIAIAVGGCRVVFLDMAAVRQQNGAEIGRRLRAVDRTVETVPHQAWDIAAMVDMGMGKQEGIELNRIERQSLPVPFPELFGPGRARSRSETSCPEFREETWSRSPSPRHPGRSVALTLAFCVHETYTRSEGLSRARLDVAAVRGPMRVCEPGEGDPINDRRAQKPG